MVAVIAKDDITEAERQSAKFVERLICVEAADANNNKFWHGYELSNGDYFAEWGRVGVTRQFQRKSGINARAKIEADTRKKMGYSGDKAPYVRQKTLPTDGTSMNTSSSRTTSSSSSAGSKMALADIARRDISKDPEIAKLVTWLAEVNIHAIVANTNIKYNATTGLFTTPLGLVTKGGIDEARQLLSQIGDEVQARKFGDKFMDLAAQFFQIIPSNAGMAKVTGLLPNIAAVQKQDQILDSLDAALVQAITPAKKDKKAAKAEPEKVFACKLEAITSDKVINRISKFYDAHRKSMHRDVYDYKLKRVYEVDIEHMSKAYNNDPVAKAQKNNWELWHGTKASNLLSIMKVGMIVPPTTSGFVTGRMFGDGLYFSDQSTKSLNYATNFWSGGGRSDRLFMFLVDVAMGNFHVPSHSGGHRPANCDSIFAQANKSGVMNNEMIVPRTSQANPRFLCEFSK